MNNAQSIEGMHFYSKVLIWSLYTLSFKEPPFLGYHRSTPRCNAPYKYWVMYNMQFAIKLVSIIT